MAQCITDNYFSRLLKTFILLSLAFILSSCSHMGRQDGPPNFYVDDSKVHNAVPKIESRAKYGNMRSYVVFGKRYYVMNSCKNYSAVGTASWYGTKFHSHRTSSGERYDMLGMTAAHKTLPLPTYVYVTNLKNNRTIIVKVNDRGPFESNRLIDLSYVAAKKLGMLGHGTTKVRVQAIDPYLYAQGYTSPSPIHINTSPRTYHLASHQQRKTIYLQVGAFRNKNNARQLKLKLLSLTHQCINITPPSLNSRLYRVQVGPFSNADEANNAAHHLKRLGIYPDKIMGV